MATLIEEFYGCTLGPAVFMLKPAGEQRLANLFKVVERARRFEKAGARTFGAFIAHLESAEGWGRGEEEAPVWEEGDKYVRLMTIHGAKGLEFPMVVIANMTLGLRRYKEPIFNRRSGKIEFKQGEIETGQWESALEYERRRYDAEELRLLYVACTRARDYLVLPTPSNGLPKGYTEPLLRDLDVSKPVKVYEYQSENLLPLEERDAKPFRIKITKNSAPETKAELEKFLAWREERIKKIKDLARPERFKTVTGTVEKDTGEAETAAAGDPLKFGTFVHDLMDSIDFNDPADIKTTALSMAHSGLNETKILEAVAMAERAVKSNVWQRAKAAQRRQKEYPLVVASSGGIESGRPDLVFLEDDKLVIVDYKTDNVQSEEEARERMDSSYREQGRRYAEALSKITNLPVKEVVFLFLNPDPAIEIS